MHQFPGKIQPKLHLYCKKHWVKLSYNSLTTMMIMKWLMLILFKIIWMHQEVETGAQEFWSSHRTFQTPMVWTFVILQYIVVDFSFLQSFFCSYLCIRWCQEACVAFRNSEVWNESQRAYSYFNHISKDPMCLKIVKVTVRLQLFWMLGLNLSKKATITSLSSKCCN